MTDVLIPGLPGPAGAWLNPPVAYEQSGDSLSIVAGPMTDLFTDPQGTAVKANPPIVLFPTDERFTLLAHVSVEFASTFDAGVLVLWADADHWAKLCFEFSPQGEPMVVSVVNNRGVSDDCNSVALDRRDVWLRVTRISPSFALHYSLDGTTWRMVRYFTLYKQEALRVGFSSQSPTGQGCRATFNQIRYAPVAVTEIRSGV